MVWYNVIWYDVIWYGVRILCKTRVKNDLNPRCFELVLKLFLGFLNPLVLQNLKKKNYQISLLFGL